MIVFISGMPKYFYQPGLNKKCEYCGEIYYHSHDTTELPFDQSIKETNYFICLSKNQWLCLTSNKWTENDINIALNSETGYLGRQNGVDCYVSKLIPCTT